MDILFENFKELTSSPRNAEQLKKLVLQLAVQGKLTEQWRKENPDVEPAKVLLESIRAEKEQLIKDGKIKRQKPLPEIGEEEKPFKLPVGWAWCRLENCGIVNPRNNLDDNITVSFIPMKNISSGYNVQPTFEIRTWEEVKSNFTHFANNDVAVAKITPCFENSKAAIFHKLENNVGAGTTELHVFRSIMADIYPEFIYTVLKSSYFLDNGKNKMRGVAGQKRVPTDFFKNFIIPIPHPDEQKAIVEKVETFFSKINQLHQLAQKKVETRQNAAAAIFGGINNAENEQTFQTSWQLLKNNFAQVSQTKESIKQLRQSILKLAVQGRLTANWRRQNPDVEPAKVLLERIRAEKEQMIKEGKIKRQKPLPEIGEEEKAFELPVEWEWCRLGNLYNIERGSSPRPKGDPKYFSILKTDYHWIKISDISKYVNNGFLIDTQEFLTYEGTKHSRFVDKNDIIIAVSGSVGKCCRLNINGYIYDGLMAIKSINNEIIMSFLLIFFKKVENELLNAAKGATWQNINTNIAKNIVIGIPPFIEQKAIVKKTNQLMSWCDELEKKAQEREELHEKTMLAVVQGTMIQ